ncbi:hypothetical protein EYF80_045019 [Liparis tanakae]|uniref:Uncharacterized protein n=1 Tax=Liparis tanakae TaxID=230148 RepID=A0A4Z2FV63_9TELE|nr:hypothetical protein EYF80_045019 [Liparis tanakae]
MTTKGPDGAALARFPVVRYQNSCYLFWVAERLLQNATAPCRLEAESDGTGFLAQLDRVFLLSEEFPVGKRKRKNHMGEEEEEEPHGGRGRTTWRKKKNHMGERKRKNHRVGRGRGGTRLMVMNVIMEDVLLSHAHWSVNPPQEVDPIKSPQRM